MNINEMSMEQINERLIALDEEVRNMENVADVEQATIEKRNLIERKAELAEIEQRKHDAENLNNGTAIGKIIEKRKEEKNMFTPETPEYRDAFYAVLTNKATAEQRGVFADNSVSGDGASLPVSLDRLISDQIVTRHPILADVDRIAFGTAIKVTQATPAGTSKRKDSDNISEMTITFVDKTLAGNDYLATVFLSYAEAKMSQGAMEKYIANAVVEQIGEAIAKDIFAQILVDSAANSVTRGQRTYYEAVKEALGKASVADNPVIYAPSALYYALLGECDSNGQPVVREGVMLNAVLKKDNAATKITVVDPKQFVLNEITAVSMHSQEMVSKGGFDIAGYARAEGCMRKVNAAAFIA